MGIRIKKNCCLILLLTILNTTAASANKILVERYENWTHPVLDVFKKYGLTLYKISYSKDGTCPTFYAKFKYSPDPRAPDPESFHRVYYETLKANSSFPFAFVDEEDDMRINVGWDNAKKRIMRVDIAKANTVSTCLNGK